MEVYQSRKEIRVRLRWAAVMLLPLCAGYFVVLFWVLSDMVKYGAPTSIYACGTIVFTAVSLWVMSLVGRRVMGAAGGEESRSDFLIRVFWLGVGLGFVLICSVGFYLVPYSAFS